MDIFEILEKRDKEILNNSKNNKSNDLVYFIGHVKVINNLYWLSEPLTITKLSKQAKIRHYIKIYNAKDVINARENAKWLYHKLTMINSKPDDWLKVVKGKTFDDFEFNCLDERQKLNMFRIALQNQEVAKFLNELGFCYDEIISSIIHGKLKKVTDYSLKNVIPYIHSEHNELENLFFCLNNSSDLECILQYAEEDKLVEIFNKNRNNYLNISKQAVRTLFTHGLIGLNDKMLRLIGFKTENGKLFCGNKEEQKYVSEQPIKSQAEKDVDEVFQKALEDTGLSI